MKRIFPVKVSPKLLAAITTTCMITCVSTNGFAQEEHLITQSNSSFAISSLQTTSKKNVKVIKIECWGGGGAGAYASRARNINPAVGLIGTAGGGGGAYASKDITIGSTGTLNIAVGSGGSGASGASKGGDSQVKYDGSTIVLAKGGGGVANNSTSTVGTGGQKSACTGDVTASGGNGGQGMTGAYSGSGGGGAAGGRGGDGGNGSDGARISGGDGGEIASGSTHSGNGGKGNYSIAGESATGSAGASYGGGGAGSNPGYSAFSQKNANGGNGASGAVVLTYLTFDPGSIVAGSSSICPGGTAPAMGTNTGISSNGTEAIGTIYYQWYCDGTAIEGATDESYTPSDEYTSTSGTKIFTRKVKTESYYDDKWYDCANEYKLTVLPAPEITLAEISGETSIVGIGSSDLSIEAQSSTGTVEYAWSPATGLNTTSGQSVTASPSATTTYTVTATATLGICTITDSKSVTVKVIPQVTCPDMDLVTCSAEVPAAYSSYEEFIQAGGSVIINTGGAIRNTSFRLVSETPSSDNLCDYTLTRVYGIESTVGEEGTASQDIPVKDTVKPILTIPADTVLYQNNNCDLDFSPAVIRGATATDNCTPNPTIGFTDNEITPDGTSTAYKVIERTWTVEDDCENAAAPQVQRITIYDTIRPTFTRPQDIVIYKDENCNYDALPAFTGQITDVWDNCSTHFDTTYTDKDVTDNYDLCEGRIFLERTWRLVDEYGNVSLSEAVQLIEVRDTIKPTFTAPHDTTLYKDNNCEYDISVASVGDVTDEADNCTSQLEATYVDEDITPEDACEQLLVIQRVWSLADDCGNKAEDQIQIITIKDTLAPTFTVPEDIVLCRDENRMIAADSSITGTPTNIVENCSEVIISFNDIDTSGTDNEYRVITRVWEVKDACENATVDTQRITIAPAIDEDNFHFDCPDASVITLRYGACDTILLLDTPSFTSEIENVNILLSLNIPNPYTFTPDEHEIVWTATDSCGFTVSCSYKLTFNYPPCGTEENPMTVSDKEGNSYNTLRIGCECWMTENLKSSLYSDSTSVSKYAFYHNDTANETTYGKLYSWYSAVGVTEGDNSAEPEKSTAPATRSRAVAIQASPSTEYVQGICPEGWAIPSSEDFLKMLANAGSIEQVKSPEKEFWIDGEENGRTEDDCLFDARGAGYYSFTTDKFYDLKGTTGFWTTDTKPNESYASACKCKYGCPTIIVEDNSKTIGYSIRCIRKY